MEEIYYVTDIDKPTGEVSEKLAAHHADTRLHAAFSCYVFNEKGQILVTKRAATKKVWPSVWTNSCCGHPAPNESRPSAIRRRLKYELNTKIKDLQLVLPRYIYKTPPYNGIVEHEFCPVFVAIVASEVAPNLDEVSDYAWMDWTDYMVKLELDSDDYSRPTEVGAPVWSWWCKDQLKQLKNSAVFIDFLKQFRK